MGLLLKLVGLVATVLLLHTALASNMLVGGPSGGWDLNTDLKSWASSHKFFTGDILSMFLNRNKYIWLFSLLYPHFHLFFQSIFSWF
ncbi:hypothetical protein KSP40_PGU008501 [Platanthera guangdongensis]|uniref:Phytocyanin domain-containing protein n=1 Tax=Platanthera guangdongensis TaxID=2320717 RepID=A0ABR2MW67_9ASPA